MEGKKKNYGQNDAMYITILLSRVPKSKGLIRAGLNVVEHWGTINIKATSLAGDIFRQLLIVE
jgi:hypothetical protein